MLQVDEVLPAVPQTVLRYASSALNYCLTLAVQGCTHLSCNQRIHHHPSHRGQTCLILASLSWYQYSCMQNRVEMVKTTADALKEAGVTFILVLSMPIAEKPTSTLFGGQVRRTHRRLLHSPGMLPRTSESIGYTVAV